MVCVEIILKDFSRPVILEFRLPLLDLVKVMLFHDFVNAEVEEAEGLVLVGTTIKASHAVLAHWMIEIFFFLLVGSRHLS